MLQDCRNRSEKSIDCNRKPEHGGKCPTGESDTCLCEDGDILDWLKEEAEN